MDETDIIDLLQLWTHLKASKWTLAMEFLQGVIDDAIEGLNEPPAAAPAA